MKRFHLSAVGLVIVLSLLIPATVRAEKIGFVDVREVIARSEAGKKAQAEFKKAVQKKVSLSNKRKPTSRKRKASMTEYGPLFRRLRREKERWSCRRSTAIINASLTTQGRDEA